MPTYTEQQIRAAIRTVIVAQAPDAVVFPWWVLGHDPNQWPGLLKPSSGVDANKAHGYVFTRTQAEGGRKNAHCARRDFTYDIWAFYWYDETSTNTASSDVRFNAELDAIANAFVNAASLPLELQRAELPQFRIDLNVFGGELLHYATGRLLVEQV